MSTYTSKIKALNTLIADTLLLPLAHVSRAYSLANTPLKQLSDEHRGKQVERRSQEVEGRSQTVGMGSQQPVESGRFNDVLEPSTVPPAGLQPGEMLVSEYLARLLLLHLGPPVFEPNLMSTGTGVWMNTPSGYYYVPQQDEVIDVGLLFRVQSYKKVLDKGVGNAMGASPQNVDIEHGYMSWRSMRDAYWERCKADPKLMQQYQSRVVQYGQEGDEDATDHTTVERHILGHQGHTPGPVRGVMGRLPGGQ